MISMHSLLASIPLHMSVAATSSDGSADLQLLDWRPASQLVVREAKVLRPKFPVIDFHNHLGRLDRTAHYLEQMDEAGVWKCVSLDARSAGDTYQVHLQVSHAIARERFHVFFLPDFRGIDEPDWGAEEAQKLEIAFEAGVRGLKIGKSLGLGHRDATGELVPVDDARIDPVWAKCGELGIPVMIHISDPKAFFTPIDRHNERYDELAAHPGWSFYGPQYPSKNELLAQRNRVIARHPGTVFVGAHVGTLPEELHTVGMWLDVYPNLYVDVSARISDLGRQPRTARQFLLHYQDRILFGTDTPPNADAYRIYYRFFETDDEYIDPSGEHHLQGRWMIYGVYLPDDVLEKIYNGNALKILGMCADHTGQV